MKIEICVIDITAFYDDPADSEISVMQPSVEENESCDRITILIK